MRQTLLTPLFFSFIKEVQKYLLTNEIDAVGSVTLH